MPISGGTAGAHDDAMHQGSAKRDVADGVAGLNSSGFILGPGAAFMFVRDGSDNLGVWERTSGEPVAYWHRISANNYETYIMVAGAFVRIQTASDRDVANGIAGLDAAGALLVPGSKIYYTRDGSDDVHIYERTSDEEAYAFHRVGADDYTLFVKESNVWKQLLTESAKDVANGIAGLDASGEVQNSVYAGLLKDYTISDDLLHSHDASVNTVSTTYVKLKTITLSTLFQTPSTIRISFKLWTSNAAETAYGRIYKNGGAVGTERTRTGSGSETFEEDLSFAQGDTLELWLKSSSGSWDANAMEFRVLGAETEILLADAIGASSVGLADPFVGANS